MVTVDEIAAYPGGQGFECYSPASEPAELDAMALRVGLRPPSEPPWPQLREAGDRGSGRSTRMLLWCLCRFAEDKTVVLSVPNHGLGSSQHHHERRLGAELRDLAAKCDLHNYRVIMMNDLNNHLALAARFRGLDPRRTVVAIDHN